MADLRIVLPSGAARKWHEVLIQKLQSNGHSTYIEWVESADRGERLLDVFLRLERWLLGRREPSLVSKVSRPPVSTSNSPKSDYDLSIVVAGHPQSTYPSSALTLRFNGSSSLVAAATGLCRGIAPSVSLCRAGKVIDRAAPMVDSRVFVTRGLNDVLAATVTLVCKNIGCSLASESIAEGSVSVNAESRGKVALSSLAYTYLFFLVPRLAWRYLRQLLFYPGHWRVAYRFIDGPGAIESGSICGAEWTVLPDDGARFYADPFPFQWNGRFYVFVEEVVHAVGKGVISVAELDSDGRFASPKVVIEEPYHLSYPQVFAHNGEVWMIPESGAGRCVVLYKAHAFPMMWRQHCVLIENEEIFDATLFEHGGLMWLVGTVRCGGSASDTMVMYFSQKLVGPWLPHSLNPVLIDKAAARPAGRLSTSGGSLMLPLQDGTTMYGGGIGVSQVKNLDVNRLEITKPKALSVDEASRFRHVHTLNRFGRLETIDFFSDWVRRI